MMRTQIHQQVDLARQQQLPHVICKMSSGWVILGEKQLLRGYCLLLPDPVVPDINALESKARSQYLSDMVLIGDVLLSILGASRINYEILGNKEPALHAHVFPRYANEEEHFRLNHPRTYDWDQAKPIHIESYRELMQTLAIAINERIQI